ncbi:ribosomal protein S14 (mitochondrion) [Malus sylvestris]|uniref:Ribosomal protein S14 n=5 Tax=Maleae TaxID=721813 RepID=J7MPX7_MALDO|nr:ribosomal protein S14 [Malus domestica]YP_009994926.1 ribosomal protein S14 [Torminalis glaberrima]YP_009994954.1 ribosomal protein S14 [Sorbus aucuparia]YP_010047141.1 ribosomal protein S14 [Pyrus betulifolia]YP_010437873.1 ribosomal protein S14 [Pyrus x bretschneideri]YP_010437959.1 ribosomal protein S14 [Photinia serratifolia]YP_010438063.1 ribosomal protein S14 [Malus baccata]YP_010438107.1 ribosomal protein S14 [Malus sieversii]YP_010438145.1 ribosomal protein S14 [Malus sylvestris]
MSEKRNIRDHKRRFLAAKYELRRKLFKAFCKDFLVICGTNIVISRPRSVYEFFQIYRIVFRISMGIKKSSW